MRPPPTEDLETLQQHATLLAAEAEALTERYQRTTWVRFALVFFPVPFVVVLLRLDLEAWHYYLAGFAYLAFSGSLYTFDTRASARCDEAVLAAGRARQAYERASDPSQQGAT
jgi:hypothetical protein